jgi:hypothetical protein
MSPLQWSAHVHTITLIVFLFSSSRQLCVNHLHKSPVHAQISNFREPQNTDRMDINAPEVVDATMPRSVSGKSYPTIGGQIQTGSFVIGEVPEGEEDFDGFQEQFTPAQLIQARQLATRRTACLV